MVVSALAMPVFGRLLDRYNPRWVIAAAACIATVGIGLMALVQTLWQTYLLYGVIFAVGSAGTSVAPVGIIVSRWFSRRMGMANSTAIAGYALGQLIIITVLASILDSAGWRWAFGGLGIINLAVVLPVIVLAIRKHPSGDESSAPKPGTVPGARQASLQSLLRTRQLWLLVVVYAVCGFQDFFVSTHVVAFGQDNGLSDVLAGNLLALMGLVGLAGVLASGWFTDSFGPMWPTAFCFALRIGIFAIALVFQDTLGIMVFALLYGSTFLITAPLVMVYTARIFNREQFGTISGLISLVHQLAGGLGAFVGAWFYDRAFSYDGAFLVVLVLSAVAVPATLLLGQSRGRGGASAAVEAPLAHG
jgi:MFS family permease